MLRRRIEIGKQQSRQYSMRETLNLLGAFGLPETVTILPILPIQQDGEVSLSDLQTAVA